jgi:hypothetical protein
MRHSKMAEWMENVEKVQKTIYKKISLFQSKLSNLK